MVHSLHKLIHIRNRSREGVGMAVNKTTSSMDRVMSFLLRAFLVATSFYVCAGWLVSVITGRDLPSWQLMWWLGGGFITLIIAISFPVDMVNDPERSEPESRRDIIAMVLLGALIGLMLSAVYPALGWFMTDGVTDAAGHLIDSPDTSVAPASTKLSGMADET